MSLGYAEEESRPSRRESPSSLRLVTVEQKVDNLDRRTQERHLDNKEEFAEMRSLIKEVLAQTTKTNGRVTSLESFKAMCVGGAIVITGVGGFLIKLIWDHQK